MLLNDNKSRPSLTASPLFTHWFLFFSAGSVIHVEPIYPFEQPSIAAADSNGSIFIMGYSNAPSFDTNGTPRYPNNMTFTGLFLIKINPEKPALDYSTWYQQSGYVNGVGMIVDKNESPSILVKSESQNNMASWTLAGDGSERGAYIIRFKPDGTGIEDSYRVFSARGLSSNPVRNLIRGTDGSLYLSVQTNDNSFSVTKNFNESAVTGEGAVVIKFNEDSRKIIFADRIAANGNLIPTSIDIAPDGSPYITGFTWGGNFNSTGFQKENHGQAEGIIAKISPDGEHLEYLTYLGGRGVDLPDGIRAGPDGSAYICGITNSVDFPLKNPAIHNKTADSEGFVAKISPDGQQLLWSTYLGEMEGSPTIVPAPEGGIWIAGNAGAEVASRSKNHIGATGNGDIFLMKMSSEGTILKQPVIFGGQGQDVATGMILDQHGNPFIFGLTGSSDFPLKNSLKGRVSPGKKMFAALFNASDETMIYSTYIGGPTGYTTTGLMPVNDVPESKSTAQKGIFEEIFSFFSAIINNVRFVCDFSLRFMYHFH